jgi:hypothetical protein
MKQYTSTTESKRLQWDRTVFFGAPAWVFLSFGIRVLMEFAGAFENDDYYSSLISNWIPWIAVFFFVLGWLAAHGVEIAVLRMQIATTRIVEVVFLLILLTLPWTVPALVSNPVFERLAGAFGQLMLSGYFLRYSMFQKRSRWLFPTVLLGKQKKAEQ